MPSRHCAVHGPVKCLGESCPVVGTCQGKPCPVHGQCRDEVHLLPVADFEALKDPKERDEKLFEVNFCVIYNAQALQKDLTQGEREARRFTELLSEEKEGLGEAIRQIAVMAWIFAVFFIRVMVRGVKKVQSVPEGDSSSDSKQYAFGMRFIEHNKKAWAGMKQIMESLRDVHKIYTNADSSGEELNQNEDFVARVSRLYVQTVYLATLACIFEYEREQCGLNELHEEIKAQMKDFSSAMKLKREFFRSVFKRFELVNDKCKNTLKELYELRKSSAEQHEKTESMKITVLMEKKWNEILNTAFRKFENAIQVSAKEIQESLSIWITDRENFLAHYEEMSERHPDE